MQLIKVLDLDIYFSCWFFKISPPSSRKCTLVKGFLFECTAYTKTLSNCTNECCFDVCNLKGHSHVHLMSQTDVISPSVSQYHRQLVLQCSMNPNYTLVFATFWKPPNYFKFLKNHWRCVLPLVNSTQQVQECTASLVTRSRCAPEVIDGGNSSLGSNFKCWTVKKVG